MDYAQALTVYIAEALGLPPADVSVETPADPGKGHFAFPCFKLTKVYKKAPQPIAQDLAEKLNAADFDWLSHIAVAGPYVNFFLRRGAFAGRVLADVLAAGERYGASDRGAGQNILVEYSSPNMAKHFQLGHLGTTIIGHSLNKIFRFLGYNVTSLNYLGDWGTQYGKLITAYLKWGGKDEIEATGLEGLTRLYVKFHEEADKDASLNDEARAWVVKMQNGDEEGLSLWRWFNELSMKEYMATYQRLDIAFDVYRGESYYSDKMGAVAEELTAKGLLEESDGAKIVNLEAYGMPPCLILRRDGGTLYPTRDIAAAIDRYATFRFDQSLYVTGNEQALHFAQWMKVVELMGYPWARDMRHIAYGLCAFESGKMSSRRGHVVRMKDVLDESVRKTRAIIEEKNPGLPDKEQVAEQVGVGAVLFTRLYNSRIKDTTFSLERMLSFEGETGPYVQYTHARASSVLANAGGAAFDAFDGELLAEDEAFAVLRALYDFPARVREAAEKYEPFLIARQLVAVAQAYNAFYHHHMILTDDAAVRGARLALTEGVRQTLKNGLALLGMQAPAKM